MADYKNKKIPTANDQGLTPKQEEEIRELIAASLANWTGITRFRTIESTITTITDFTDSQHNHENAAGGGQIGTGAITGQIAVPKGGTGASSLTNNAVVIGQGSGAVSTITGFAGTGSFYVAASSGGAVTRRVDYDRGVITNIV